MGFASCDGGFALTGGGSDGSAAAVGAAAAADAGVAAAAAAVVDDDRLQQRLNSVMTWRRSWRWAGPKRWLVQMVILPRTFSCWLEI